MHPRRDLTPGSTLGGYELSTCVATRPLGQVWAARRKEARGFERLVAIKTLSPELSGDPTFEQRFLDETALASRLKHPNVVEVIELGEVDSMLYQVLEWVDGASLSALLRASRQGAGMPLVVAGRIVHQLCAGVHAAHELTDARGVPVGFVHRDLSPSNVLIATSGVTKVSDFGVARFRGRGAARTQVGELRGTVPYMAPEHVRGEHVDRRADVFSLGVLLHELVGGAHPFVADDERLTLARIASDEPAPALGEHVGGAREEIGRVLASALVKRPERRTRSATELMSAIGRAIPGAGLQSSDALVARYLDEILGATLRARALEIRETLRDLDGRAGSGQARALGTDDTDTEATLVSSRRPARAPVIDDDPTTQVVPATTRSGWSAALRFGLAAPIVVVAVVAFSGMSGRDAPPPSPDVAFEPDTHAAPVGVAAPETPARDEISEKNHEAPPPEPPASAAPESSRARGPRAPRRPAAAPPAPAPSAPPRSVSSRPRGAQLPPDEFAPGGI